MTPFFRVDQAIIFIAGCEYGDADPTACSGIKRRMCYELEDRCCCSCGNMKDTAEPGKHLSILLQWREVQFLRLNNDSKPITI